MDGWKPNGCHSHGNIRAMPIIAFQIEINPRNLNKPTLQEQRLVFQVAPLSVGF